MTILLVEDESRLAAALIKLFHAEKYLADNGEDGLYAALQKDYDVIVLDVMLPKEVCRPCEEPCNRPNSIRHQFTRFSRSAWSAVMSPARISSSSPSRTASIL